MIARGQLRTIPEGDSYTFINSDRESEQHNDTKVYYEVNTGYIRSVEYRNLWYEFFRSTLRCVTDLEGNIRNIIVDEYEAEYNEYREITSFTFKFHMADREMPAVPVRLQMDGTPSEDMEMAVQSLHCLRQSQQTAGIESEQVCDMDGNKINVLLDE